MNTSISTSNLSDTDHCCPHHQDHVMIHMSNNGSALEHYPVSLSDPYNVQLQSPTGQILSRETSQKTNNDDDSICSGPYTRTTFGIPLYMYQDIPPYMKGNPYITCGYRADIPTDMCVKSLFIWSNETLNIWTHLLGFFYFFYLLIHDNFSFLLDNNGDFGDHITFTFMDITYMICMCCSASYHLFHCMSESASKKWLRLDLGGISVGLCGCYFPGAYYAFYCHAYWQLTYMVLLFMLALTSMVAQLHPQFLSSRWQLRRLFLYAALVFAGIIPVTHWVVSNGGINTPLVQVFVPKLVILYILAIIGGTFYITQFPESKFPGRVDFVGSSHQWWHIFVFLGFAWTHHCSVVIYYYWRAHSCSEHFLTHQSIASILGVG